MLLNRLWGVAGLAALLCSMPACVVPAAPNFQDPMSFPEVPPWIHDPSPEFGQVIQSFPATITVQVTDLNGASSLRQRWLINYPVSDPAKFESLTLKYDDPLQPLSGDATTGLATVDIKCGDLWTTNPAAQRLELIVADGDFQDIPQRDAVVGNARRSYANWTLLLQCSSSPGPSQ